MALPSTGTLSFNDIRIELGVSGQSPFGLDEAENGTYAVINQCSPDPPSATNPAQISEWYGYNHTATASIFLTGTEGPGETADAVCAFQAASDITLYVVGTVYYQNSNCSTVLNQFYRNSTATNWYQFSNGQLIGQGACTTTTTSTTTASPTCACNQKLGICSAGCSNAGTGCATDAECF